METGRGKNKYNHWDETSMTDAVAGLFNNHMLILFYGVEDFSCLSFFTLYRQTLLTCASTLFTNITVDIVDGAIYYFVSSYFTTSSDPNTNVDVCSIHILCHKHSRL
ncbi:hypothetical protein XENOCAPTIV_021018 [Xenoophorus captivus]|uniref:G-protein coupled receptors family 1 profile domain-containing protein n=1 Tax=Xenoophorus captivus TaxID=1517983 RepID=A0ABV0SAP5_9TELE